MPTFLVERYLPGMPLDGIRAGVARTRDAADAMRAQGFEVRHRATLIVAEDDLCLCRFTAASAVLVEEACQRAEFPFARILAAAPVRLTRQPTSEARPARPPIRTTKTGRYPRHG